MSWTAGVKAVTRLKLLTLDPHERPGAREPVELTRQLDRRRGRACGRRTALRGGSVVASKRWIVPGGSPELTASMTSASSAPLHASSRNPACPPPER